MRARSTTLHALVGLAAAACSDGAAEICSAGELGEALAAARAGSTVTIGRCRIEGALVVPAGVAVVGRGRDSVLAGGARGSLVLTPGEGAASPTRLEAMRLELSGEATVIANGAGHVRLKGVELAAWSPLAIGARGTSELVLEDVVIDRGGEVRALRTAQATSTTSFGLVLADVGLARLNNLTIRGATSMGAVFASSNVEWRGGSSSDNGYAGVVASGGTLTFEDVELRGNGLGTPYAFGLAAIDGVTVESRDLRVLENGPGYGVLHQLGSARHLDAIIERNAERGLHAQQVSSLELSGRIAGNRVAGVALFDASGVWIHDASIEATAALPQVTPGGGGSVWIGDGIHAIDASDGLRLHDLTLRDHARAGVLLDLGGGALTNASIERVSVTVTSTAQAAAVAQNGQAPAGWDSGILRNGTTAIDDARFVGALAPADGIGPCDLVALTAGVQSARGAITAP